MFQVVDLDGHYPRGLRNYHTDYRVAPGLGGALGAGSTETRLPSWSGSRHSGRAPRSSQHGLHPSASANWGDNRTRTRSNKFKMAKYFDTTITNTSLSECEPPRDRDRRRGRLDGIYVIRANVPVTSFDAPATVTACKTSPTSNATSARSRPTTWTCARSEDVPSSVELRWRPRGSSGDVEGLIMSVGTDRSQGSQVHVAVDATELLAGLGHARCTPAQCHLPVAQRLTLRAWSWQMLIMLSIALVEQSVRASVGWHVGQRAQLGLDSERGVGMGRPAASVR